jgi:HPt (histidine-containing phosphotransfer) domain-containing protein
MQDLLATFMPKFAAVAKTRITRSIELANQRTPEGAPQIAREMHAIAGEAGLLGIGNIVQLARAGEDRAKRLQASRSDADADALLASLTELKNAIELVCPQPEAPRSPTNDA